MYRILIGTETLIIAEREFSKPVEGGATITFTIPQTAAKVLGIVAPIAVEAELRERSATYRFTYQGEQYRLFAASAVLAADEKADHA